LNQSLWNYKKNRRNTAAELNLLKLVGLTVTVIVKAAPVHVPVVVGVTIYSTVPAVALLGFVSV
jgi:hypothetical protein